MVVLPLAKIARNPEIYHSGFGALLSGSEAAPTPNDDPGFGGLIRQEPGEPKNQSTTDQQPGETGDGAQNRELGTPSLVNTDPERGMGGPRLDALTGSLLPDETATPTPNPQLPGTGTQDLAPSPSLAKGTPTKSSSEAEAYPVLARRSLWQKVWDAVSDQIERLVALVNSKDDAVAYDADLYQYAKARQLATQRLTDSDMPLLEMSEQDLNEVFASSIADSQTEALGDYQRSVLGTITLKTNLEGATIGPIQVQKAYKLAVTPVKDVDIVVPGRYVALTDYQDTGMVFLGLREGAGQVLVADNEYAIQTGVKSGGGVSAPSVQKIVTQYQRAPKDTLDTEMGLVAFGLYHDANANGRWDPDEVPVPWAGVEIKLM